MIIIPAKAGIAIVSARQRNSRRQRFGSHVVDAVIIMILGRQIITIIRRLSGSPRGHLIIPAAVNGMMAV